MVAVCRSYSYITSIYHSGIGRETMKLTLTTMQGNTRNIDLMTKQEVLDFIDLFKSTLHKNQRVKITCDLLGIDGYVQGTV